MGRQLKLPRAKCGLLIRPKPSIQSVVTHYVNYGNVRLSGKIRSSEAGSPIKVCLHKCTYSYPVTVGVKQGYVMAPTLFSFMFSAMVTNSSQQISQLSPNIGGKLFNLRRWLAFFR